MRKLRVDAPTNLPTSLGDIRKQAAESKKRVLNERKESEDKKIDTNAVKAAERATAFIKSQGLHRVEEGHLKGVDIENVEKELPKEEQAPKPNIVKSSFADLLNEKKDRNNSINSSANPFPEHGSRIVLPSKYTFNDFKEVFAKPLDFASLCLMHTAKIRDDESMFIDILNETISCDIRDLCFMDFRTFLYWQRLHSFVTIPYSFTWRSMYGNDNVMELKNVTLKIKSLSDDIESIKDYPHFTFPTVRITEEFNANIKEMKEEGHDTDSYAMLVKSAQYCKGKTLSDRIELCKTLSMEDLFVKLPEFIKKYSDFGVVEEFTARDVHFKADTALAYLEDRMGKVEDILEGLLSESANTDELIEPYVLYNDLKSEIDRIKTEISSTGEAVPMNETRKFSISIADFFPNIPV